MPQGRYFGSPARFDDGGGVGLDDDGGPLDAVAGPQRFAVVNRGVTPLGLRIHAHHVVGPKVDDTGDVLDFGVRDGFRRADGLDRDGLDDVAPIRGRKPEAPLVDVDEGIDHRLAVGEGDDKRRIGAFVPKVGLADDGRVVAGYPLIGDFPARLGFQTVQLLGQLRHHGFLQGCFDGFFPERPDVGQPHAIGAEHTGKGMNEDAFHGQRVGDPTRVLPAGAAETVERIFGNVVAALHGYLLDGVGHVLDRDLQEPFRHFFRRWRGLGFVFSERGGDVAGEFGETIPNLVFVQGLIGVKAEELWEIGRLDPAQHDVAVGDRQRPAAAITGRSRIGAGGIGADAVALSVEMQDRAAARGHRMNAHHRRAHAYPGDGGLEGALEFAVEMGNVG